MKTAALALLVSVVLGVGFKSASADTLGAPIINLSINQGAISLSGAGSIAGVNGQINASGYYTDGKGFVAVSQTATEENYATANAQVFSAFEVLGPAGSNVPLVFTATGSATASALSPNGGDGQIYAYVGNSANGPNIYSVSAEACAGITGRTCSGPSSFDVKQSFSVATNTTYWVSIDAGGLANYGTFSAQVDPSVTFDPSFNESGYSIVYSADAPPVPLPSSVWLMLSGLGGLGAMVRKRRAANALPSIVTRNPIQFWPVPNPAPTERLNQRR
jgi:hypothetical protein